jgi:hypothetical protein
MRFKVVDFNGNNDEGSNLYKKIMEKIVKIEFKNMLYFCKMP